MTGAAAEALALVLVATVLVFAMVQPHGLPEATVAVPAAGLAVALGVVGPADALTQVRELGPTVGFLAAVLVLAHLADVEGVFRWLGDRLASVSGGRPRRLLLVVFAAAALTTAVLSLDATVVLLTPVVFGTRVGAGGHPPDGGLRRCLRALAVELGQQLCGDIGGPAGDRSERPHARRDRGRAQREHHRDRVNPALVATAIGDLGEQLQQLRTHHPHVWKITTRGRTRTQRPERGETRIGDGTMKRQRSSGGEKSVRGLLVLPELRRSSRRDTPKITKPAC